MKKIKVKYKDEVMYALVDDFNYDRFSKHKWYALKDKDTGKFYALRYDGKGQGSYMHREVLGLKKGDGIKADHIKGNRTLDNRRCNLRKATPTQSSYNIGVHRDSMTGYKGVSKNGNGYSARIQVNKVLIRLGTRKTPKEASELYKAAARKYHGKFRRYS